MPFRDYDEEQARRGDGDILGKTLWRRRWGP